MRNSRLMGLLLALPFAGALAQTHPPQMNVMYECMPPYSFKFLSCAGTNPSDLCDVQSFNAGRPWQRGNSTYAQVMAILPACHLQTPAEAQAAARNAATPAPPVTGGGGFKVGDTVRVLVDGWFEAKVLQVNGNSYRVHLPNGLDVVKFWPIEVRRVGKLTAEDHAAGQYDVDDRVQVLVNGKWAEGSIRGQMGNNYQIKVPGVVGDFGSDMVSTTPENIRMSNTAPPAPPTRRAEGQAPKPGLASCAGKFEGRYASTANGGALTIVFRSGKATVRGMAADEEFECWTGDGKIMLYAAGSAKPADLPIDINDDGTLDTPLGELKKKAK